MHTDRMWFTVAVTEKERGTHKYCSLPNLADETALSVTRADV